MQAVESHNLAYYMKNIKHRRSYIIFEGKNAFIAFRLLKEIGLKVLYVYEL